MKEWVKVALTVLLIAAASGDLGLRTVIIFGCEGSNPAEPGDRRDKVGQAIDQGRQDSLAAQSSTGATPWCRGGRERMRAIDQWIEGLFGGLKITDIFLALFTLFLVRVGWSQRGVSARQAAISEQQTKIMGRQTDIAQQSMTIGKQPRIYISNVSFHSWMDRPIARDYTEIEQTNPASGIEHPFESTPSVSYQLNAVGETPATIRMISEELVFEEGIPKIPGGIIGGTTSKHYVLRNGDKGLPRDVGLSDFSETKKMQMRGYDGKNDFLPPSSHEFFLIGAVVYDDVFANQHELRFCYRAYRGGGQGYIYGGNAYNSHRLRAAQERI